MADGPFTAVADGVRVAVRLTPGASRNAVAGLADTAAGGRVLKVSVTAVPEAGKANAALVKLLAKEWRIAKSDVALVAGATDRTKTLLVAGPSAALLRRLEEWAAALPGL